MKQLNSNMPSVDKTSVQQEISRVKTEFDQLCDKANVSSEVKLLMNSMLMIIALMLSIFLEKKTKKNNKNASIPSAQTEKDETALGQTSSKGKGKKNNDVATNAHMKKSDYHPSEPAMFAVNHYTISLALIWSVARRLILSLRKSSNTLMPR